MSIQEATPSPLLRTLSDDTEYTFEPLTLSDWSAFCMYINSTNGEPPKRLVGLDEMGKAAYSIDGMMWLCHRSASRGKKSFMPLGKFRDLMSLGDMRAVVEVITDFGDTDSDGSDPPTGEAPQTGPSSP